MFANMFNKISRLGVKAARSLGNAVNAQGVSKQGMGFAVAVGAFGATTVYLLNKKLSAQEVDGGFLYTWYLFSVSMIIE